MKDEFGGKGKKNKITINNIEYLTFESYRGVLVMVHECVKFAC